QRKSQTLTHSPKTRKRMCQYEQINYACGHSPRRLHKHCHFARNDPSHSCFGAYSVNSEF
ncbi:hypothetical protein EJ08DRAFT_577285, partial [Tothia fuscella]